MREIHNLVKPPGAAASVFRQGGICFLDVDAPPVAKVKAYQSSCDIGGKTYLLRVIVDDAVDPAVVVTVYRTTRIGRYWGKP